MRHPIASCLGFASALSLAPLAALAQQSQPAPAPEPYYYRPGPWMMWGDGYGWHGWWMFPMMLLFFMLACGAVFYLGHALSRRGSGRSSADWDDPALPALRILNERFARGEIQRDEFEDKKATLLFGGRR